MGHKALATEGVLALTTKPPPTHPSVLEHCFSETQLTVQLPAIMMIIYLSGNCVSLALWNLSGLGLRQACGSGRKQDPLRAKLLSHWTLDCESPWVCTVLTLERSPAPPFSVLSDALVEARGQNGSGQQRSVSSRLA